MTPHIFLWGKDVRFPCLPTGTVSFLLPMDGHHIFPDLSLWNVRFDLKPPLGMSGRFRGDFPRGKAVLQPPWQSSLASSSSCHWGWGNQSEWCSRGCSGAHRWARLSAAPLVGFGQWEIVGLGCWTSRESQSQEKRRWRHRAAFWRSNATTSPLLLAERSCLSQGTEKNQQNQHALKQVYQNENPSLLSGVEEVWAQIHLLAVLWNFGKWNYV